MDEVEPCVCEGWKEIVEKFNRTEIEGDLTIEWVCYSQEMDCCFYPTSKQKSELYGNIITLTCVVVEGLCHSIISR